MKKLLAITLALALSAPVFAVLYKVRSYCEDDTVFKYEDQTTLDSGWKDSGCEEHTYRDFTVLRALKPNEKSGVKTSGSFSGNPQAVTVTFGTAFPDANYSVSISGSDVRDWSVDSQAAASFVINSNAGQALSASAYWTAIAHYDP